MTLGAGLYPIGTAYAGLSGLPATVDEPGPAAGSAFVDQNGDYQVDGTGDIVKTTPTAQRAMLLLRTVIGSIPSQPSLGLNPPTAIDATFDYTMRRAVESALLPMTSDGSIEIVKVDITRPLHFRASIAVTYIVLATGEQEIVSV